MTYESGTAVVQGAEDESPLYRELYVGQALGIGQGSSSAGRGTQSNKSLRIRIVFEGRGPSSFN